MGDEGQLTETSVKANLKAAVDKLYARKTGPQKDSELLHLLGSSHGFSTEKEVLEFGRNLCAYRTLFENKGDGLRKADALKDASDPLARTKLDLGYSIPDVDPSGEAIEFLFNHNKLAPSSNEVTAGAIWLATIRLRFTKEYQDKFRNTFQEAKGLIDGIKDQMLTMDVPNDFPFKAQAEAFMETTKENYKLVGGEQVAAVRAAIFEPHEEKILKDALEDDVWGEVDSGLNDVSRFIAAAPENYQNKFMKHLAETKGALKMALQKIPPVADCEGHKATARKLARYMDRPGRLAMATGMFIKDHPMFSVSLALKNQVNDNFASAVLDKNGSIRAYVINSLAKKSSKMAAFKVVLIDILLMSSAVAQIAAFEELRYRNSTQMKKGSHNNETTFKFEGIFWFVPVLSLAYIEKFRDSLIAPWFSCGRYAEDFSQVKEKHATWIEEDGLKNLRNALKDYPLEIVSIIPT